VPRRPQGKRVPTPDGSFVVRAKLANGEGSVYTDQGSWRATWTDAAGKVHRVRGRTRAEAVSRRDAAVAADLEASRRPTGAAQPVADLARWWLDNVATYRVRETSLIRYRARVERIAAGAIGKVPIGELRAEQVAEWSTGMMRSGLGPKTVADVLTVLRQVLDTATDLGHVPTNVAKRVPNPKPAPRNGRALSVDDARKLLDQAAGDDRYGAAVGLLFVNGWRVSEVLGLGWADVDLEAGTAVVRRAAVFIEGKGMTLGPTKTAGAVGVHRLSERVVDMLRRRRAAQAAHRLRAGQLWRADRIYDGATVAPVFTDEAGELLTRQGVAKAVKRHATAAGIDATGLGTHGGRRTVVTALYGLEGIDLADIARHVGHADTATTAGYVRDLGDRPERTAAAIDRLMS